MSPLQVCEYTHTVGMYGDSGKGFFNPVDVGLGADGRMYVISRGLDTYGGMPFKRVTICSVSGEFFGQFSGTGTGDGDIMWPVSCAISDDGEVYISDEALHRISVFDRDGAFLRKWGVQGAGPGEFNGPSGVAFDHQGNLLVADSLNNRVQRYTRDGRYVAGWGRPGAGAGEFNMPWGIAVGASGEIYVADWRNDRIQRFDSEGLHLATWPAPGEGSEGFYRPSGVAVGSGGHLYVADWGNHRVVLLDSDGGFVMSMKGEATLSTWADDYFASNPDEFEERQKSDLEYNSGTHEHDRFLPEQATVEKVFWGPTSVKADEVGRVYVVDSGRHRVQVYQEQTRDS